MLADRRVSPDAAFLAALRAGERARRRSAQPDAAAAVKGAIAKGSIGKGAVAQALRGLDVEGDERVGVVQRFLDGKNANALSPAARATLIAFVQAQQTQGGGASIVKARQTAGRDPITVADDRVLALLQRRSRTDEAGQRYARVAAWLDVAEADLAQAGARLAGIAGATADAPTNKGTAKGMQQLTVLLGGVRKGDVTKGDVDTVRRWLSTPPVPPAHVTSMRRTFERLDRSGTLSWTPGGVAEQHRGIRFARVALTQERHADGFSYTAMIPVGALAPGARLKDPGRVDEFYVERTGGLAGLTLSVGPLRVGGADRPPQSS